MNPQSRRLRSKQRPQTVGIWLFPLLIIATIIQNYYDLMSILSGEALALDTYSGPLIYKLGKDLIYISLLASIVIRAFSVRRSPLNLYSIVILIIIAVLYLISAISNGVVVATIGLRWALPFILFLTLSNWIRSFDSKLPIKWILGGMIICSSAQIYQIFYMPPIFGEIFLGIPARTPGIFLAPNSTAFFACAGAACVMTLVPEDKSAKRIALVLALLISLLAQSGTGIIAATVLILRAITNRRPVTFWTVTLVTILVALMSLNSLTMRENYVELSGGGRLEILADVFQKSALSVSHFGLFTNAANLQSANPEDQTATDSLVASWIGNFGAMSIVVFGFLSLFVRFGMSTIDWKRAAPCVLVFLLFSFTTIVFEAFPMNIFIAIGIWSARKSLPMALAQRCRTASEPRHAGIVASLAE